MFTICSQHVQQQGRALGAFAVFAGLFLVRFQEAAQAGFVVHPAKDGGEDEALPGLQLQQPPFAGPLALDVGQQFSKGTGARCHLGIEHPGPVFAARAQQVIRLALHSEAGPFAGGNGPAEHIAHVLLRALNVFIHGAIDSGW